MKRLKQKKDTVTWFGYNAKRIANKAGNGRSPRDSRNEKERVEYFVFRHYHPAGQGKNAAHSSYVFG